MENKSKLRQFKEDDIIVSEGQTNNEMYKILSGKVAAYLNYKEENECLLGIFDEQRTFGESGMLCNRPCMYTVVALEDTLVLSISMEEFNKFINMNVFNAHNVIRNLAREVAIMKCNLDMVMKEYEHTAKCDKIQIKQLKEKMNQSTVCDWKNCSILENLI